MPIETVKFRLGVVIPMASEEETAANLLDRIRVQLTPEDCVFIVLDKASKDRTRELVQHYGEFKDNRFSLIWAPENCSVVDAYFRGYREAYQRGCQWILEMDGGLSHLPEEIPQFIEGMKAGFEYVGGSRYIEGGKNESPVSRRLISWGGTVLARFFLKAPMTDMTSGFECFSRSAMQEVLERDVMSRANFFQTEIRYAMSKRRWKEVPIHYANNKNLVGRSSLREAFRVLFILWRQRRKSS